MNDIDLNELLQLIIKDKGGTSQQYNQLMDQIAYHETGALQRMDPYAMQEEGGPGRGLFQFEVGEEMGGNTAVNRTHNYLTSQGAAVPTWLHDIWAGTKSVDFTTLEPEQQKMLFLGNYMMHPQANLGEVMSGNMTERDFWANYHWAGKKEQEDLRLQSWDESMASWRKDSNITTAPFMADTVFGEKESSLVDKVIE